MKHQIDNNEIEFQTSQEYPQIHANSSVGSDPSEGSETETPIACVYASPEDIDCDEECYMEELYGPPEVLGDADWDSEMYISCKYCGYTMEKDFSYCPMCGKKRTEYIKVFCINCGARIKDEYSYCPFCGKRLSIDLDFTVQDCPKCKAFIPLEAHYCPFCGADAW